MDKAPPWQVVLQGSVVAPSVQRRVWYQISVREGVLVLVCIPGVGLPLSPTSSASCTSFELA